MARRKKIRTIKMPVKRVSQAQRYMNELYTGGRTNMWGAIPYLVRYCGLERDDAYAEVCKWVDEYNERRGLGESFEQPMPTGSQEWLERPMSELVQPKKKPPKPGAKPRGWHFKKFFEFEGKVYSLGKEVTNAKEIKKLRKEYGSKQAD